MRFQESWIVEMEMKRPAHLANSADSGTNNATLKFLGLGWKMAGHLEAARTILERREKFAKFYGSPEKPCNVFRLNGLQCDSL